MYSFQWFVDSVEFSTYNCHLQIISLLPFQIFKLFFFFFLIAVAKTSNIFLNINDNSGIFINSQIQGESI